MDIKNATIVITGGAQGIGEAMARRLAEKGANIVIIDFAHNGAEHIVNLMKDLGANGGIPQYIHGDVTSEQNVEQAFQLIHEKYRAVDVLINNAGVTRDGLLIKVKDGGIVKKMSLDDWNMVQAVNLTGPFLCGREAAGQMALSGNGGLIINISSVSRDGIVGQTNYSATKAGVHAMTDVWARELAKFNIRAVSIAPGFIGTEMVRSMKPAALEAVEGMIPQGRIGEPDEIAQAVEFIITNDYVNGTCIEVNGALRLGS